MTYLYNLVNTDKVVFTNGAQLGTAQTWDAVYRGYDPVKEFLKGKTAFLLHESWVLNQQIKAGAQDTNMEYGMVPYPIGPDAKDYTSDSRNNRLFTLIRTNKDYEKSAVIFNALARPLGDEKGLDYWDDIQADYFQTNDKEPGHVQIMPGKGHLRSRHGGKRIGERLQRGAGGEYLCAYHVRQGGADRYERHL